MALGRRAPRTLPSGPNGPCRGPCRGTPPRPRRAVPVQGGARLRRDGFVSVIDAGNRCSRMQAFHWSAPFRPRPGAFEGSVRSTPAHPGSRPGDGGRQGRRGKTPVRAADFRGFGRIRGDRGIRPAECRLFPAYCRKSDPPYENHTRSLVASRCRDFNLDSSTMWRSVRFPRREPGGLRGIAALWAGLSPGAFRSPASTPRSCAGRPMARARRCRRHAGP